MIKILQNCVPNGAINQSPLVQVVTGDHNGDKLLPKPVMALFIYVNIRQSVAMSQANIPSAAVQKTKTEPLN